MSTTFRKDRGSLAKRIPDLIEQYIEENGPQTREVIVSHIEKNYWDSVKDVFTRDCGGHIGTILQAWNGRFIKMDDEKYHLKSKVASARGLDPVQGARTLHASTSRTVDTSNAVPATSGRRASRPSEHADKPPQPRKRQRYESEDLSPLSSFLVSGVIPDGSMLNKELRRDLEIIDAQEELETSRLIVDFEESLEDLEAKHKAEARLLSESQQQRKARIRREMETSKRESRAQGPASSSFSTAALTTSSVWRDDGMDHPPYALSTPASQPTSTATTTTTTTTPTAATTTNSSDPKVHPAMRPPAPHPTQTAHFASNAAFGASNTIAQTTLPPVHHTPSVPAGPAAPQWTYPTVSPAGAMLTVVGPQSGAASVCPTGYGFPVSTPAIPTATHPPQMTATTSHLQGVALGGMPVVGKAPSPAVPPPQHPNTPTTQPPAACVVKPPDTTPNVGPAASSDDSSTDSALASSPPG
eukprot:Rmarinus@m.28209